MLDMASIKVLRTLYIETARDYTAKGSKTKTQGSLKNNFTF